MILTSRYGEHRWWMLALLLGLSAPAYPENDPSLLQQQAIKRIDSFIDHFRKTGDFTSRLSELQQAEKELTVSNAIFVQRNDWAALALGLIKLGTIQRAQGKFAPAITFYRQAEDAAIKARHPAHQATALIGRTKVETSLREYGDAAAHAAQAVRLAEPLADKAVLFDALGASAQVQIGMGRVAPAAESLNRALMLAPALKDPAALLYGYFDRAGVYVKIAETCDYQVTFEPCYAALDRARSDYTQALGLAHKLGYTSLAGSFEGFLKSLEARKLLIESRERVTHSRQQAGIFHPKKPANVSVSEEFVLKDNELPPSAGDLYRKLQKTQHEAGTFASTDATSQYIRGLMLETEGDNDGALIAFMQAVELLEKDRRSMKDESSRGTFVEDKVGIYYAPLLQLLQRGRVAEAFDLLERSRSRGMADLLANKKLGLSRPDEQRLYAESVDLKTKIAAWQNELLELASAPEPSKHIPRMKSLESRVRQTEAEYQRLLARTATEAPRLQELVVSDTVSLKKLQQSMRAEHYEVLEYLVLQSAVIVWHISADAVHVRSVFLPRAQVIAKVTALQNSAADPHTPFDETTAQEMFLYLVQPMLSWIKSERLVIIPHEHLQHIPFQLFKNPANKQFLGERYRIAYAPSATVLLHLKKAGKITSGRLLAVADPSITAATHEVTAIAKLFPGRNKVVNDQLASEQDVKAWVRDYDVVHLSVHGKFNAGEPLLSYLELGKSGADDGRLTAAEMFGLPLEKSPIVVLSACETGKSEATHGNEVLGMVRSLLYAGANSLVLSYWKVDSAATALWMQTFYEAARSVSPDAAARSALTRVKKNPAYNHPYYWGAFMLVGR